MLLAFSLFPVLSFAEGFTSDKIKGVLESQFSGALGKVVKIGELQGNLYNKVVLKDVKIAESKDINDTLVFFAKDITIHYSLKSILLHKGTFLDNIFSIDINKPWLKFSRNRQGDFNFSFSGSTPENKETKPLFSPKAKLKITIKDGKGLYIDRRGWKEKPVEKDFIKELTNLNATISIKNNIISYTLSSRMPEYKSYSPLRIYGKKSLLTNLFEFTLKVPNIDIAAWTDYTVPMDDIFTVKKGKSDLQLTIMQKEKQKDFDLGLNLNMTDAQMTIPLLLKKELKNIKGKIFFSFKKLEFNNIVGKLDNLPVVLNGSMYNYDRLKVNLSVNIKNLAANKLPKYIYNTPELPVTGLYDLDIKIKGFSEKPLIAGKFKTKHTKFLIFNLYDAKGFMKLYGDNLSLDVKESTLYKGSATFKGNINFKAELYFNFVTKLKNSNVFEIFKHKDLTGKLSTELTIKGGINNLKFKIKNNYAKVKFYNQDITKFEGSFSKIKDSFIFKNLLVTINSLKIPFSGEISDYNKLSFSIKSTMFAYHNNQIKRHPIALKGLLTGVITGTIDNIREIKTKGKMLLNKESLLLGESAVSGIVAFHTKSNRFFIESADLSFGNNNLLLNGDFSNTYYDINLLPGSNGRTLETNYLKRLLPGLDTSAKINGRFNYHNKKLMANFFLDSNSIKYRDITFEKARGSVQINDNIISFKDTSIINKEEKYQLNASFPIKKKLGVTDNFSFKINTQKAHIKKLYNIITAIRKSVKIQNPTTKKSLSLFHFIALPKTKLIYSTKNYSSILNSFKIFESLNKQKQLVQAQIPNGLLSGELDFVWGDQLLKTSSSIVINDFVYQDLKIKNIESFLKTDNKDTKIDIKMKELGNTILNYPKAHLKAIFRDGNLIIDKMEFSQDKNHYQNILKGTIPIIAFWDKQASANPVALELNIPGDSINIFSLFFKVNSIKHSGDIKLDIQGAFNKAKIKATKITLKDLKLTSSRFDETLNIKDGRITIGDHNNLKINYLDSILSDKIKNELIMKIFGEIGINHLNLGDLSQMDFKFNLKARNTKGSINLENLYTGKVALENFSLKGTYNKLKSQTSLKGIIRLNQGSFFLPKIEKKKEKKANFNLDITLIPEEDIIVKRGKNLIEGDFSNFISKINIIIAERKSTIKIGGTIQNPKIKGKLFITEGYITFLNRDFTFIDSDHQRKYFRNNPQEIGDNYLDITTNQESDKNIFNFNINAETIIYEDIPTTENSTVTTNTTNTINEKRFIIMVRGVIDNISSYTFIKYKIENLNLVQDGEPYYLIDPKSGKTIDDSHFQELAYDLAPSFIKNPSQATGGKFARDIVFKEMNQYIKSILRPYEKIVAKRTGLYDIKIKGDFAKETARLLNIEDSLQIDNPAIYNEQEALGLELIYELYKERLFFSLDTSLTQLNSYKLTWNIFRDYVFDDLSASLGNEYDFYRRDYTPVFSLEVNDAF